MKVARNIVAGAVSGLGVVILLQQYAVAYPTGIITMLGVLVGIAVQFGVAHVASNGLAFARGSAVDESLTHASTDYPAASWMPTHRAPESGLDAWTIPDGSLPPAARLDPRLEVRVDETSGDWARITCENGWSAWVDQRKLEAQR